MVFPFGTWTRPAHITDTSNDIVTHAAFKQSHHLSRNHAHCDILVASDLCVLLAQHHLKRKTFTSAQDDI